MDTLTQIGVGGIFAILILREVFAFLHRREAKNGTKEWVGKIDKMFDWQNVFDDEGVPIWYVRKSLEEAIRKLSSSIGVLHGVIREQNALTSRMIERIESLHGDIRELRTGQIEIEQILRSLPDQLKPPA